jgi:hypothetical protein
VQGVVARAIQTANEWFAGLVEAKAGGHEEGLACDYGRYSRKLVGL